MPILTNLTDSKRLTLPNLDGLGRLMDLLTNHFKVEIGTKLIDHHRQLADEKMLREASGGPLADNEEIQKVARLTDIFHRLPHPGAHIFLKDLTDNVVASEAIMFSTTETPFTAPLAAFFEKYFKEAVDYLFEHVAQPRHVRTLRSILMSKRAPAFNNEVMKQIPRLVSSLRSKERFIPGLSLCLDLATLDPDTFAGRDDLIQALLDVWDTEFSQEADVGYHLPMVQTRIPSLLISMFRICMERVLRLDMLFSLIAIYTQRIAMDLSGLTRFLHVHVILGAHLETKRDIFKRFLAWFDESIPPIARITQFLRVIINPMIIATYSASSDAMDTPEKLITTDVIDIVHRKVWSIMAKNGFPAKEPSDALTIELIHMTGLMIQHCPDLIHETRKDVMKSAWASVSSEDAVVKQTSNLLIARFFKAFDSPSKLILKVWAGLLRPQSQNEGRHLIRQAVDTLAPALPIRVKEDTNPPSWVKVTKRFLLEEAGGLSSTIAIYRVIIRHADLFFPYVDQFSPHMINSLGKLLANQLPETRLMTLDILDHIMRWEKQGIQNIKDGSSTAPKEPPQSADGTQWLLPTHLREAFVNFLVRLVLQADAAVKTVMVPKSLRILHDMLALQGWGDVGVRPQIFDRMLTIVSISFALVSADDLASRVINQAAPNDEHLPHAANALKLLYVSVEDKPPEWFAENLQNLKGWLERPFNLNDPLLDELSAPIMTRIISSLPTLAGEDEVPMAVQGFYSWINGIVNEGIRSNSHVPLTLAVLQALVRKNPASLEEFAGNLSKMFGKVARECIQIPPPPQPHAPSQVRQINEPATRAVKSLLEIWRVHMPISSEHRKSVLFTLQGLVEKSVDVSVCRLILDMCHEWVFAHHDGFPTMREKAGLLAKMTCLEYKRFEEPIWPVSRILSLTSTRKSGRQCRRRAHQRRKKKTSHSICSTQTKQMCHGLCLYRATADHAGDEA